MVIHQNGFWLRAPDISIVDIIEPPNIYRFDENDIVNFAYFELLNTLNVNNGLDEYISDIVSQERYNGFSYYISQGWALENEIRMGGSDKRRIFELADELFYNLTRSQDFQIYLEGAHNQLGQTRKIEIMRKSAGYFTSQTWKLIDVI